MAALEINTKKGNKTVRSHQTDPSWSFNLSAEQPDAS